MPTTHELKIKFSHGHEIAKWEFDDCGTEQCCKVNEGDKLHFTFDGPGKIGSCIVLSGQMENNLPPSPFQEGSPADVTNGSTLTFLDQKGLWGFSIAFTARNDDGTTSFYYVPDPEVVISNHPGSGD